MCKNLLFIVPICSSTLRYAGSKDEVWFTITTWLIQNNAKKLAFIDEEKCDDDNQAMKRFNLYIENRTDLSLVYLSPIVLQSQEETTAMIEEINAYAELDAIFCISLVSFYCS